MLLLILRYISEKEADMNAPTLVYEMAAEHISREKLIEDLKMIVADTEELWQATANQSGLRIAAARIKVGDSLQIARRCLAETLILEVEETEETKVALNASNDYWQINSCQPMDIIAALGLALGGLNSRR